MATDKTVQNKLESALSPEFLTVTDFSDGCGTKLNVIIVSEQFEGKPLIQRHRLVNQALSEEMPSIHALTMKTYTPAQWKEQNIA